MRNLCNNETHYFVFRAWLNYIAYPCSNFKFSFLFTTASPWLFFFSLTLSFKQRYLLLLKKLHRILFLKQCFLQFSNFHQESFILVGQPLYFFVFVYLHKNDWTFTPPIIQEIYYVFVQILCFIFLDYVVFQLIFFIFLNLLSDRSIGNILLFGILLIHFNNIKNKIKNGLIVYMITHILITPVKVVYF